MSAKRSDHSRIIEIHDIVKTTKELMSELQFTEERFLNPTTPSDILISEGILNRIFRLTEELSNIDEEISAKYELNTDRARGVRNRLAHAYGEVKRPIIWEIITEDFDQIEEGCRAYCKDIGVEL